MTLSSSIAKTMHKEKLEEYSRRPHLIWSIRSSGVAHADSRQGRRMLGGGIVKQLK